MNFPASSPSRYRRLALYAWIVAGFNVLVALWGAYVRASGSGAGCGAHWPLCNGEFVPATQRAATWIEFAHRASSGLDLLAGVLLTGLCFRFFPPRHRVRRAGFWALIFLCNEAVLGAALVLLREVGRNQSWTRVGFLSLHLVNTFLLLAALALTARWCGQAPAAAASEAVPAAGSKLRWSTALVLLATMLIGITGAIAALGDTLFPQKTLAGALHQDVSQAAPLLLRARVLHPLVAISLALVLLGWIHSCMERRLTPVARRIAWILAGLVLAQLAVGVLNIALLAPIPVQMLHLLGAYLLWMTLVLFANEILTAPSRT